MRQIDVSQLFKLLNIRKTDEFIVKGYEFGDRIISSENVIINLLKEIVTDIKGFELGDISEIR